MKSIYRIISPFVIATLSVFQLALFPMTSYAASLTALSDSISSLKTSTVSNHDILFTTPTGIAASANVTLTFQSDYSIAAALDYTDIDVLDDGVNVTLAAAPSGATWGAVRTSATVITLTNGSSAVAAGSVVRIKIGTNATSQSTGVRQITNPTTTGTKTVTIAGGFGDTGTISSQIVSDDTVAVSATVPQSISFALSANSISFGTLDSGAARYADTGTGSASDTVAHTLAVATNGTSGYTVTVQGATLTSGGNTITAVGASPAVSSVGSEQFGIYATKAGGTNATIDPTYATASSFGYDATAATATTFSTGTSATATETYSLHYIANIAALTEAGSYSTNLTYVATANF
ncbi:MAG TPA: hypothetical protein PKZ56_00105 [Candidatus Paceibacterota bacterium]|jgi:hypothetical protein|nr:hypothetical protein [Candidatus Paceibacterota bacterium]